MAGLQEAEAGGQRPPQEPGLDAEMKEDIDIEAQEENARSDGRVSFADSSTLASAPSQAPPGPRVSAEMKRMLGTSIIKEIGVEERFKQLAALVGQSTRFSSSSTVVLHNVTHKYSIGEESKAFPTVGEVIVDPFLKLGKRVRERLRRCSSSAGDDAGPTTKRRELCALRDVSTVLEPARLYLVIGGPKCGKTSLLKAISGRPPTGSNVKVSGSVLFNGERAAKDAGFNITHVACYVEETDNNEPLLTVRETLEFAGTCILPVPTERLTRTPYWEILVEKLELDAATKAELMAGKNVGSLKVRRAMAKERAKVVMSLLGLANCSETIIGDHTHRGVSGGERRRVTLAEVVMGEYSVACFDEISNGLDSAATFDIIDMLRASVHHYQYTCAVALNQPSPEVYALFDEVIVLKAGQIAYQGPPDEAKAHFESLGFRCPPHMDLADFVVAVTGKAAGGSSRGKLIARRGELAEAGQSLASVPSTTSEFAKRFRRSSRGRACLEAVERVTASVIADNAGGGEHRAEWRENERMKFYNSWATSLRVCLEREVVLTLRDRSYIAARLLQDLLLGLLTGLIFFNLNIEAVSTRFGAIYQTLLTIAFQTAACVPAYFTHRRVFYKQKAAGFFSCSSYLLASTLAAAPLVLLDSVLFGTIVYWCMGFARDGNGLNFVVFLAHLTMLGWAMMCFFRLTTYLCPDLTTSAGLSGVISFFLLLFSGFVMAIQDVPTYYLPVLYANPVFWCFQALASNEFLSSKYSAPLPGGATTKSIGETILEQKGLYATADWVWYGLLANAGITGVYLFLTWAAMRGIEHHEPVSADASPEEAMSSLFSAASFRQPGSARRATESSWDSESDGSVTSGGSGSVSTRSLASGVGGRGASSLARAAIPEDEELKGGESEVSGYEGDEDEDGAAPGTFVSCVSAPTRPSVAVTFTPSAISSSAGAGTTVTGGTTISSLTGPTDPSALSAPTSTTIGSAPSMMHGGMRQASSTWQLAAVSTIPFVPCALSFEEVRYAVPDPKGKHGETLELLKGINGYVAPGTMMALMGSSGAGKTTLLDVLAGRKTGGTIHGDILVNGAKLDAGVFKAIVGYVEQFGCISPYMTVAEVLHFNAELRLPASVDPSTRRQFVADVLRLLELTPISDSVVGPPGGGLSFEELKRVTIGAEVVANPSIVFCDEPTTGLDARAAMIVVRVLRKLAQTGRAIIATIHQPSKEIFTNFDSLLLLKKGGLTVYCGPLGEKASTLINYFESVEGTPKFGPAENPASWMLECLGAGTGLGEEKADYVTAWRASPQRESDLAELHAVVARAHEEQGESMALLRSRIRARFLPQLRACFLRAARASWRMPEYQLARIGGTGALGLALGSLYWNMSQATVSGMVSFIALVFLATTFVSSINATSVLQTVALEKPSFARERFNRMYNVMAYVAAAFLVEVPWVLVQALIYMATFYTTCGYNPEGWRVMWYFAFSFLYMLFSTAFGQAVGAVCPSVQVAQIALNCILPIFSMMSGMTIIPIDLPRAWRPLWIITPMNKAFEGLVMTQWGLDTSGQIGYFSMRKKKFMTLTKEGFVQEFFGSFSFVDRYRDLGVLFAYIFVCNLACYLALKYRRLENR